MAKPSQVDQVSLFFLFEFIHFFYKRVVLGREHDLLVKQLEGQPVFLFEPLRDCLKETSRLFLALIRQDMNTCIQSREICLIVKHLDVTNRKKNRNQKQEIKNMIPLFGLLNRVISDKTVVLTNRDERKNKQPISKQGSRLCSIVHQLAPSNIACMTLTHYTGHIG